MQLFFCQKDFQSKERNSEWDNQGDVIHLVTAQLLKNKKQQQKKRHPACCSASDPNDAKHNLAATVVSASSCDYKKLPSGRRERDPNRGVLQSAPEGFCERLQRVGATPEEPGQIQTFCLVLAGCAQLASCCQLANLCQSQLTPAAST